jgi:FAD/FMN-containing dehydrogenase
MKFENFGRNVRFEPHRLFIPTDKDVVLAQLDECREANIRAFGSLHSWSDAAVTQGAAFDLRHLHSVRLEMQDDGSVYAEIEAGCTVDAALDYLRLHGGYTLPTYGIIGKQTIAGAIATATHGSGRASLSHYVTRVTAAAYDRHASGRARTYDWESGDDLRAARCGLGCTGIVLSVRMRVEPDYLLEERIERFERLDEILEREREYPRQQFYLIPWTWNWLAQLRRPLDPAAGATPSPTAWLLRIVRRIGVDVLLNGIVRLLSGYLQCGIQLFYRHVFPLIAGSGIHVIDHSSAILRMRHDLYVHVEMELFVPAPYIRNAAAFVEWVLRWCGGESPGMPEALTGDDFGREAVNEIRALQGSYAHDYLVTFRRVLADDTLISMTSGGEFDAWYAVSLITYQRDLKPFLEMARFLAATMASAYRARPHWGKICPLETDEIAALYPALGQFRAHCASVDPNQVFVNDFTRRALGFRR